MATITRRMDELRRIVIPKETEAFGWRERTSLDIEIDTEKQCIILREHNPACRMCGEPAEGQEKALIHFESGEICRKCLDNAIKASLRGEKDA